MLSDQYRKMLETPHPSEEENLALIKRVQEGDTSVAWEVVCLNSRLVMSVLADGFHTQINDQAFSDGLWGFYNAVIKLEKNTLPPMFFVYVKKYIWGYVVRGIKFRQTQFKKLDFRPPQISLNDDYSDKDGDALEWLPFLKPRDSNDNMSSPSEIFATKDNSNFAREFINRIMGAKGAKLTHREKEILKVLIECSGNASHAAIKLGVSRQMICYTKNNIIKKIKKFLWSDPKLSKELYDMIKEI